MGEVDTLGDVALEAIDGLVQKRLLLVGDALEGVCRLFRSVGLQKRYSVPQSGPIVFKRRGEQRLGLQGGRGESWK